MEYKKCAVKNVCHPLRKEIDKFASFKYNGRSSFWKRGKGCLFVQLFWDMCLVVVDHFILPWITVCGFFADFWNIRLKRNVSEKMSTFLLHSPLIWWVLLHSFCWLGSHGQMWLMMRPDPQKAKTNIKKNKNTIEKFNYVNLTRIGWGLRDKWYIDATKFFLLAILPKDPPSLQMTIRK